jgi:segregation and condensation protein A
MSGVPSLARHPFSVALPVFEGPLDLLLHLVQQEQLDITEVSLVQVTGQYLAYMRSEQQIDHQALADFIAIGARLIELKSRALLPSPPPPPALVEEEDPEDLVVMLKQYQQFKEAALALRSREENLVRAFPRLAPPPDVPELPGLSHVTLAKLMAIVQRALEKPEPPPPPAALSRPRYSVRHKLRELDLMLRIGGRVSFSLVIQACRTREEIITSFFAVLELMKAGRLLALQETPFGDILLEGREAAVDVQEVDGDSEAELAGVQQAVRV